MPALLRDIIARQNHQIQVGVPFSHHNKVEVTLPLFQGDGGLA